MLNSELLIHAQKADLGSEQDQQNSNTIVELCIYIIYILHFFKSEACTGHIKVTKIRSMTDIAAKMEVCNVCL